MTSQPATTPAGLEIETTGDAIHIQQLTGDIQTRHFAAFHGGKVDLAQINPAGFPQKQMDRRQPLPKRSAFFYRFATSPYQLSMALDDIVPAYDADHGIVINVKEDDLTVDQTINLRVRDAGLRGVKLRVPAGFVVAAVTGKAVDDYAVEPAEGGATITGDLTFHGVTKSVSFFAKKVGEGDDPYGNHRIGYTAEFVVKRSEYGVIYGIKGGVAGDEITLMVSLEGVRKK